MGFFDKLKKKAKDAISGSADEAPAADVDEDVASDEDDDEDDDDEDDGYSVLNSEWYEKHLRAGNTNHFGQLDPDDLDKFMFVYFELEEAEMNERLDDEMAKWSISDKDEWGKIWASFLTKHFAGLSEEQMNEQFLNAALNARGKQTMLKQQAAAEADPTLLEPVEGVTVEQWAQAAAAMGSAAGDEAKAAEALAGLGMDRAKYDRVNDEFQARMQRDTNFVIAGIYGKAFSGAQGIAGGYGLGNADGSAQQLGEEPCTYDRYVEITGAQAAWGEQGVDVNAKLKEVFDLTAMDISAYGGYWSTKMQADAALMLRYGDDLERAKEKFKGAGLDDDLSV